MMKLVYETGSEVYSIEPDFKGEILIEECIDTIQDILSYRNPDKYEDFLKSLKKTEIILRIMNVPEYKKRVQLLRYTYYAFRLFDDICDGDTLINISGEERKLIIEGNKGIGLYDVLINKAQQLASELGILSDIQYGIDEIVGSIQFDVDRIIDTNKFRKKKDLDENFYKMDISGTIHDTALIFGLLPESTIELLEGLGTATRMSYNIADLQDDIIKGFVNIPIEELEEYLITEECFEKLKQGEITVSIQNWIQGEIFKITILLQKYDEKFSFLNIIKGNGIDLLHSTNYFRKLYNNLLLKYVVLPVGYSRDIRKVIGKYN